MTRARSAAAGPAPRRRPASRLAAALLVGAALTGVAACGSSAGTTPVAQSTPATTPPPTPTPTPPPPPPVLWPLTGLESGPVDPRPALAVKVENSTDARPQTGLGAADLVWEQVVEGGISRYVAVYHSSLPARIGPVRSVRPMDPAIAAPLHGLFAFSGGQAGYVDAVAAAGMQVLSNDAGADGFSRTGERPAPHNVQADPLLLLAQADPAHRAAPPPQFDLAATADQATAVTAGTPATSLALRLSAVSRPQWTWSPPEARWLRSEGSTPAVEADGARLGAANVVVLRVDVRATAARDPAGNPVPETVMVAGGEALVATEGHTVAATWVKTGVGERVVLRGADGNPVRLAPGTTWVELVPNAGGEVAVG